MNNICVYCGSSYGNSEATRELARELGQELAKQGIGLVYGGAAIGIMGIVADAVLSGGGRVTGVIPKNLSVREVVHESLTELHVVGSMHQRKALMEKLSDGFITLPGGLGTLDELFEILTWAQLGIHSKPVGILDNSSYFTDLMAFLDRSVKEGFVKAAHRNMLLLENNARALLAAMHSFEPVAEIKLDQIRKNPVRP